jgi:hypothetical protein
MLRIATIVPHAPPMTLVVAPHLDDAVRAASGDAAGPLVVGLVTGIFLTLLFLWLAAPSADSRRQAPRSDESAPDRPASPARARQPGVPS